MFHNQEMKTWLTLISLGAALTISDPLLANEERKSLGQLAGKEKIIYNAKKIPAKMRACASDEDCVAGIMGCWLWVPINKKFLVENGGIFGGRFIKGTNYNCTASDHPGPRPKVGCSTGVCERK